MLKRDVVAIINSVQLQPGYTITTQLSTANTYIAVNIKREVNPDQAPELVWRGWSFSDDFNVEFVKELCKATI